jgi:formate dehydrogenase maturation protein FdhE
MIIPLEIDGRSDQRRDRAQADWAPDNDLEPVKARRSAQCPVCNRLAVEPVVSGFLKEGVVEHHWQCNSCHCEWTTQFRPMLVSAS